MTTPVTTNVDLEILAARLRAILIAFRSELKPELQTPNGKLRGDLLDMQLSRCVVDLAGGDPGEAWWGEVEGLIGIGDAKALQDKLGETLTEGPAGEVVTRIAAGEDKRRTAYETDVATMLETLPAQAGSSGELAISPETFTAYLRKKFPDDPTIAAQNVVIVPGGRSKGTILVDYVAGGEPQQMVVRKDFAFSVTGTSVVYEYPIIKAAFEGGLVVPEPLWLEEEATDIGPRFIAFRRVSGKSMGTLFSSDAPPEFVLNFAVGLAKLHQLDIEPVADKLRFGRDENPVRALIESFYDRYKAELRPNPLMDAAFAWLRGQIDQIGNVRKLVHGDAGLHNTMGDGHVLTAILDWEFVHAGDPAEDLTYCKYLVERLVPWDQFMAAYEAAGGDAISEQRMRFFTVWRTLHLAILTGIARETFDKGIDRDLRVATIGYNTFPKQLRDLAKDLAAYTAEGVA